MRSSERIALFSAVLLCIGAIAAGREAAGTVERIAADTARAKLAAVGFQEIQVEADGMVVALSGRVASDSRRDVALAALQATPEIGFVIDNLVLVRPLVDLRPATLTIRKDDAEITLTGEAPNPEARDLLAARAQVEQGRLRFLNLMKAQDRRASEGWLAAAEAAIDAVSALRVGSATVERGVVRLEGAAFDAEASRTIRNRLRRQLGDEFVVEFDVTAPPPLLSPYVFTARKTVAGLALPDCAAPNEATRSSIYGVLRGLGAETLAADPTTCIVANGAPNDNWTLAVIRALEAVDALVEAEARIVDDRITLAGFVEEDGDIAAAQDAAVSDWPSPFSVEVDIREVPPIVRPYAMTAVKRPGDVRLSGFAPSRERAETWSQRLDAVNELQLARGAPEGWAEATDVIMLALEDLKIGAATLTDRRFLLAAPGDASIRAQLRDQLAAALPVGFTIDVVEAHTPRFMLDDATAAAAADPTATLARGAYTFIARRAERDAPAEIVGLVGDDTAEAVVTAYARAQLGGDDLAANVSVGDDAPPLGWQRAVFAGIESLAALKSGEMIAEPDALYLRGAAASAADARRALAALADKTPEEFTRFSRITITEVGPEPAPPPPGPALTADECEAALNATIERSPIAFDVGAATIEPTSDPTLDALTRVFGQCPEAEFVIGGHTDSQGADDANLALSRQRAAAVRLALVARRVDRGRLTAEGYGASQPIADNATEAGRARNRRIEFALAPAEAEAEAD